MSFEQHERRHLDPADLFSPRDASPNAQAASGGPRSPSPGAQARSPTLTSAAPPLKLVVRGFNEVERKLLEATVKLSLRRTPQLHLLSEAEVDAADVVMIDARDAQAMDWARRQSCLDRKAVIWVDGQSAARGHTIARRPVQWPILPMLLARALEQGPAIGQGAAASAAGAPLSVSAPQASAREANVPAWNAHTPASTATSASSPSAPTASRNKPILVVDDSLAVRGWLRSQLEARGHQVIEVASAQAAIDAVTRSSFACVLMDVLMPGMDGYEGCKQIKARLRGTTSVPIVMLTSKSSPFDRIRGKMAGCDAYLTKPIEPAQLHEVLVQQLTRNGGLAAGSARPAPSGSPASTSRTEVSTSSPASTARAVAPGSAGTPARPASSLASIRSALGSLPSARASPGRSSGS